jgi:hypothetical protein
MTFLACAFGFGSRNLLFAARRALRLGMSSSSSRSLADRVILSRGGDERMGYDIGFLKVLTKSPIGIGTTVGAGGSRPTASSSSEPTTASTGDGEEVPA